MKLRFDLFRPVSIEIPTRFWNPAMVDAFHLPAPEIQPVRSGDFVGDTAQGGSVNCFVLSFCPHGSGTHTECMGHIVTERLSVLECHDGKLLRARLVSVEPIRFSDTNDGYAGTANVDDWVVDAESLQASIGDVKTTQALIVRVRLPSGVGVDGHFSGVNAPFFTAEAMDFIHQYLPKQGHLLTNLPSIDREQCGGHTPNHRILWGVDAGVTTSKGSTHGHRTLTELIQGDFELNDGEYVLDLQIAPFDTDAAPSRPILYPLI